MARRNASSVLSMPFHLRLITAANSAVRAEWALGAVTAVQSGTTGPSGNATVGSGAASAGVASVTACLQPQQDAPLPSIWIGGHGTSRSEEHTSELQSLMRISYAVFCLKKKKTTK